MAIFSKETPGVATSDQSAVALKPLLEECGYSGPRLATNYNLNGFSLPLVGFASKPWDFDSACIAVLDANGDSERTARSCYELAAPVVWVRHNGSVDWWVQRATKPELFQSRPVNDFPALVRLHKTQLEPASIYRGKTIARIDKTRQLDFVDLGLMPLRREEAGKKLGDLVEEMTQATLKELRQPNPNKDTLRKVFTSVFRLLAGKILKDKGVRGFAGLEFAEPASVLVAVTKHYDTTGNVPLVSRAWSAALKPAASLIGAAGGFGVVSPETLAYVYEHTLVTKALRKKLGIHATPPWLVDYMVWRLYDWIRAIPRDDRHVFEPACGHAPFLLSAMRLLRLEVQDEPDTKVHAYLKGHIHGVEVDAFAREIARLSLTLADIPNPNGWDLKPDDMFASNVLAEETATCRVLLSNPPYERFNEADKIGYAQVDFPIRHRKAVELLDRTLKHLPPTAVFGVIVPQGVLHSTEARELRELLLRDFDIREVCLFADKVFEEGEAETVVMLGRRRPAGASPLATITYRWVRENSVKQFANTYAPDSEHAVHAADFVQRADKSFRVPDLPEVWALLATNPRLDSVAAVGQGFSFGEKGLITKARQAGKRHTTDSVRAVIDGVKNVSVWQVPPSLWLSPQRTPVRPWRSGNATGKTQILVNYVRVMRGPWRLKAFIDNEGHAAINTYTTVRPLLGSPPLEFLWAVLNSPLANAFAYCHTLQKHIYDSLIASLPLPFRWKEHVKHVVHAANSFLALVREPEAFQLTPENNSAVCEALLNMDAAVMRAYGLPVRLERAVLDLFRLPTTKKNQRRRKGVGCKFGDYYPTEFKSLVPLHKFISSGYRDSTVDRVAARMKPNDSSAGTAALRAAVEAFGGDE
jgi:hypothetical protein